VGPNLPTVAARIPAGSPRDPEFDLHGYEADTALAAAREWTRDAWEHGCRTVTFVHGSAAVTAPPPDLGRGGPGAIKWTLRRALRDGCFAPYAERGARHTLAPDLIRLVLATCPDPDPSLPWTPPPPREW